jgi:Tfp pilus assembly protein PilF
MESLWNKPRSRTVLSAQLLAMLYPPNAGTLTPSAGTVKTDPAQVERVRTWLEQAVQQDPQNTRLLVALGNLYERLQDYRKAEELYRTAIKQNDREIVASNNLAWLIALQGGPGKEALELINKAIQFGGPLPDFLDTRGVVYLGVGQSKQAVADLETAVKAEPTASKYFHLAQAYLKDNDRERAKKSLETAETRGLPEGLHDLELAAYHKVVSELKTP